MSFQPIGDFKKPLTFNRQAVFLVLMMPAVGMILALVVIVLTMTNIQTQILVLIVLLLGQYVIFCMYLVRKTNRIKYAPL